MTLRSFLFVPGDSEKKLTKGEGSGADAIILDLEDSVSPTRKPIAREMVQAFLAAHASRRASQLWVRMNPIADGGLDDLVAVRANWAGSSSDVLRTAVVPESVSRFSRCNSARMSEACW